MVHKYRNVEINYIVINYTYTRECLRASQQKLCIILVTYEYLSLALRIHICDFYSREHRDIIFSLCS